MMPELPEVTTIVRDLSRTVGGKVIRDVWTDTPKIVAPLSVRVFRARLAGKAFVRFERRGKFILASLGTRSSLPHPVAGRRSRAAGNRQPVSGYLVWHLRMTGHPLYRNPQQETRNKKIAAAMRDPRNQHIRLQFLFTDGTRLDYSDVRKFGTIHLLFPPALGAHPSLRALGPDAWAHPWTADELCARLRRRRTGLKQALLDQQLIAGIGNIYADEVLWTAKMHPLFRTEHLTRADCTRLLRAMHTVLAQAIRARGASIDDFRDLRGMKGKYGDLRRVYQRAGHRCFRCGANIAKLVVAGRGTHVCRRCQRLPRARGTRDSGDT